MNASLDATSLKQHVSGPSIVGYLPMLAALISELESSGWLSVEQGTGSETDDQSVLRDDLP